MSDSENTWHVFPIHIQFASQNAVIILNSNKSYYPEMVNRKYLSKTYGWTANSVCAQIKMA